MLVYLIIKNKPHISCLKAFDFLKRKNTKKEPELILIDFEDSLLLAFK